MESKNHPAPAQDPCPFGGGHTFGTVYDGSGIACRKCHKTFGNDGVATYDRAALIEGARQIGPVAKALNESVAPKTAFPQPDGGK